MAGIISSFTSSITPILERRQIRGAIASTEENLNENVRGSIEQLNTFFSGRVPEAKEGLKIVKSIQFAVHFAPLSRWSEILLESVDILASQLAFLMEESNRSFSNTVAKDGITFRQTTVLAYINYLSLYADALLRLCHMLTLFESKVSGGTGVHRSKAEIAEDEETVRVVLSGLTTLFTYRNSLGRAIAKIVDAEVTEETEETVLATRGKDSVGLSRNNIFIIGPYKNIFSYFGRLWVERGAKQYRLNRETKIANQLRLQELRELRDGDENFDRTKLSLLIKATEDRIEDLTYRIRTFEEENLAPQDQWS